jgi:arylsulfatase A
VPPTVFTAKKPNDRHVDYRIMPPYQNSPEETRQVVGTRGMEVAPDFIDNQCLTRFTDKAIEWMSRKTDDAKAGKPFFVYLPYTSPHYPVCPLPEFHGKGECGGYGEFVIETDYHVGRILDFLSKSGLDEDTMIVFSSDNGPETSWKQRIEDFGHHSSGPYRGGKRDIYEGGHRVPFFVRWPGGIFAPGRAFSGLVGQTDLLATFANITGATLPDNAGEDSQSFATVLKNPVSNYSRLPIISHGANGRFAITARQLKLIMPHGKAQGELYDLSSDPGETMNLATRLPGRGLELMQQLTDIVCNGRTTVGAKQPNDTGYWSDLTWLSEPHYNTLTARPDSGN